MIVKYDHPLEKKKKTFSPFPGQSMPLEAYHLDSSAFPDYSIWICD